MNRQLFPQNVIAMIWDFDKTLIPGNMQGPLFRHYDMDEAEFWREVDGLEEFYRNHGSRLIQRDHLYLNHILTYVREGRMPGLGNALLRELGSEIEFYTGMPDFLELIRKTVEAEPRFAEHQIRVEHYVVSTGLREMILGSALAPQIEHVWACEFTELVAPPEYPSVQDHLFSPEGEIRQLIYTIDNTSKTRALFEINKGTNKNPAIDVNAKIAHEDRRVPFSEHDLRRRRAVRRTRVLNCGSQRRSNIRGVPPRIPGRVRPGSAAPGAKQGRRIRRGRLLRRLAHGYVAETRSRGHCRQDRSRPRGSPQRADGSATRHVDEG